MAIDPERFGRAYRRYHKLCELSERERRDELANLEREDPEFHRDVKSLFEAAESGDSTFLHPPRWEPGQPEPAEEDLSGKHLGDFELRKVLGRGGMGTVYEAVQHPLGRTVAVKVMRGGIALDDMGDLRRLQRFVREAKLPARQPHRGLVPIIAYGEQAGRAFYAMELIRGCNLAQLQAGAFHPRPPDLTSPESCARFTAQIAQTLHHCHEQGIIHRDVKPQNILVDDLGRPRLVDFGIAKYAGTATLTTAGEMRGTPLYMSPEQAESWRHSVDYRTDIYSLGAVLYELLAGRPPFTGNDQHEILHRISHDRPAPVRSVAPNCPVALQRICETALQKDPRDRYESAAWMAEDLQRLARGEAVCPPRPSWARRLRRQAIKHRWIVGTALLLSLGIAGAWALAKARAPQAAQIMLEVHGPLPASLEILQWRQSPDKFASLQRRYLTEASTRLDLPVGFYRLRVANASGGTAELVRVMRAGEKHHLSAHLTTVAEVRSDMVSVAGGSLAIRLTGIVEGERRVKKSKEAAFESFLIDRSPVTNGEYLRYLKLTHAPAAEVEAWQHWPDNATEPPVSDWDARPATLLTLDQALAYAEFYGKTLPTAGEWAFAVQGGSECGWLEDIVAGRSEPQPTMVDAIGSSILENYFHYCKPVRQTAGSGLFYDLGNVAEMTATLLPDTGAQPWSQPLVVTAGRGWGHSRNDLWDPQILREMGHQAAHIPAGVAVGFRCVKRLFVAEGVSK